MQRLFHFFDSDESGSISFAELLQGLAVLSPSTSTAGERAATAPPPSSPQRPRRRVAAHARLPARRQATTAPHRAISDKMKLAFLLTDIDAAGGVSLDNLRAMLRSVVPDPLDPSDGGAGGGGGDEGAHRSEGADVDASALEAAFDEFDADGDRLLSYDEWCRFLERHTSAMAASMQLAHRRLAAAALDDVVLQVQTIKADRRARSASSPNLSPG